MGRTATLSSWKKVPEAQMRNPVTDPATTRPANKV